MKEYKIIVHRVTPCEGRVFANSLKEAYVKAKKGEFKEFDFFDEYETDKVIEEGAQVFNETIDDCEDVK